MSAVMSGLPNPVNPLSLYPCASHTPGLPEEWTVAGLSSVEEAQSPSCWDTCRDSTWLWGGPAHSLWGELSHALASPATEQSLALESFVPKTDMP